MADQEQPADWRKDVKFFPIAGSPVTLGGRDKMERTREAIVDLNLVLEGFIVQAEKDLNDSIASFARHCSIFLRKMVIGDRGTAPLLDEDTCRQLNLVFPRLRKVTGERRSITAAASEITDGVIMITKRNEESGESEGTLQIPIGRQQLTITAEWPLPGMADWLEQATEDNPWQIGPSGLFDYKSDMGVDDNAWLGQQLVLFDNRSITLKEVVRIVANTEAAHAPPIDRLAEVAGGEKDHLRAQAAKASELLILSNVRVCGVRYHHAIVIQTTLCLYQKLFETKSVPGFEKELKLPVLSFMPADGFSPEQRWLSFDGGLMTSLGGGEQVISHNIRGPR